MSDLGYEDLANCMADHLSFNLPSSCLVGTFFTGPIFDCKAEESFDLAVSGVR
jgi:hypothetical protein